jgi:hypothetical protein
MPYTDEPWATDTTKETFLRECLDILPEAISEELIRVPGEIAYWNAQYSDACKAVLEAKARRKEAYARLYIEVRNELTNDPSIKRPTEMMIESTIIDHPDYALAVRVENDAEARKVEAYGWLDAVRAKKDILVSLGGILREEMRGDPILRRQIEVSRHSGEEDV